MQNKAKIQPSKLGEVTAELEETKLNLTKAKEEGNLMAHCLNSLRQELEQTKKELRKLKTRETLSHILDDPEVEETKFVEKTKNVEMIGTPEKHVEFEKKRSVKFASPLLVKTMDINVEESTTKTKKTKKKPLVPLFGGLFLKKIKKGARGSDS